jgi:hypothetical protein
VILVDGKGRDGLEGLVSEALRPLGLTRKDAEADLHGSVLRLFSGKGKVKVRRILLLIDDCDRLLHADAGRGFPGSGLLASLSDETSSSFRAVLCGGRHARAAALLPESPLARGRQPLALEPLDYGDAASLLTRPLNALGVHFPNPYLPLRALSLGGWLPGPSRLFGEALRDGALEDAAAGWPPPGVVSDREAARAFRRADPAAAWREALEESLNGHSLYRVVYYAVWWAGVQGVELDPDNPQNASSAESLLSLLKQTGQEPFERMDPPELKRLLDEMADLGLLGSGPKGYRTRAASSKDDPPGDEDVIIAYLTGERPVAPGPDGPGPLPER